MGLIEKLQEKQFNYCIDEPNHIQIYCEKENKTIFSGSFNEFMEEIRDLLNLVEDPM